MSETLTPPLSPVEAILTMPSLALVLRDEKVVMPPKLLLERCNNFEPPEMSNNSRLDRFQSKNVYREEEEAYG